MFNAGGKLSCFQSYGNSNLSVNEFIGAFSEYTIRGDLRGGVAQPNHGVYIGGTHGSNNPNNLYALCTKGVGLDERNEQGLPTPHCPA